ncbi:hypothetical protein EDB19DRAFT_1688675 [Suillus lakei]|nr:hypothetical protein EDB19DRAFT_1688675 [Suillus lakei]
MPLRKKVMRSSLHVCFRRLLILTVFPWTTQSCSRLRLGVSPCLTPSFLTSVDSSFRAITRSWLSSAHFTLQL